MLKKTKNQKKNKNRKKNQKNKSKHHFRIGVDFGGVLAKHTVPGEENLPVTEHKNTSINMPGAVETLKKLKRRGHQLYIISFCGKARALQGMEEIEKEGLTPVFTEQIYIRDPYAKGNVVKNYGCNFMIDDRLDLLNAIKKISPTTKTIWFGQPNSVSSGDHICAETWDDVYEIIRLTKAFHIKKEEQNLKRFLIRVGVGEP